MTLSPLRSFLNSSPVFPVCFRKEQLPVHIERRTVDSAPLSKKDKRAKLRLAAKQSLDERGEQYVIHNGGSHLALYRWHGRIDYFPTTHRWTCTDDREGGEGSLDDFLAYLDSIDKHRASRDVHVFGYPASTVNLSPDEREKRLVAAKIALDENGEEYTTHNNGIHCILTRWHGRVDFWPTTGRWKCAADGYMEGSLGDFIGYLRSRDEARLKNLYNGDAPPWDL